METTISTQRTEIKLDFIPQEYSEQFIKHVLHCYSVAAEYPDQGGIRSMPDISSDIASISTSFYLVGALYQETGDPKAYSKRVDEYETGGEFSDAVDDLFDEFSERHYSHYHEDFAEDIESIMNHFHLAYMQTFYDGFSGKRFYDGIHNRAVIEVW